MHVELWAKVTPPRPRRHQKHRLGEGSMLLRMKRGTACSYIYFAWEKSTLRKQAGLMEGVQWLSIPVLLNLLYEMKNRPTQQT